jgi:adenosylmethionine-8-amino-7-oxononanoate aminotransferase
MGGVLLSKKIADGMRSRSGIWQHGYTYQAHPICCAAALAVQQVIDEENLLANNLKQGALLGSLLNERLAEGKAAPYVLDIRGQGCWWAIEFDIPASKYATKCFGRKRFGPLVDERCFASGLMVMGMSGGANYEGTLGDHIILAPSYNVTEEEVRTIVDVFVKQVEDVLVEGGLI